MTPGFQLPSKHPAILAAVILFLLLPLFAAADTLTIAVASNFTAAMEDIAEQFEEETGHQINLASASTGVHYTQITNGAPFDAFFAADAERPALLESAGRIPEGTRFTYARGRLALWSARGGLVDDSGSVLRSGEFRRLAIANPETAPYGKAAHEVLNNLGLLEPVRNRLVTGTNIAQTHQFVSTGAAELGFVAYSQITGPGRDQRGSWWLIPADIHSPIDQQAVVLRDTPAVRQFMQYMRGGAAREIIESYGYSIPRQTSESTAC